MQSAASPDRDNKLPSENARVDNKEIASLIADLSCRDDKDILGHEAVRVLRLLWPAVFRVSSPKPVKIGIDKDIAATGLVPENIMKIGLRCFTRLEQYLECTRAGRARIGLDGKPAGQVRLDEAVNADLILYARYCRNNPPRAFVGQLRRVTAEEVAGEESTTQVEE